MQNVPGNLYQAPMLSSLKMGYRTEQTIAVTYMRPALPSKYRPLSIKPENRASNEQTSRWPPRIHYLEHCHSSKVASPSISDSENKLHRR